MRARRGALAAASLAAAVALAGALVAVQHSRYGPQERMQVMYMPRASLLSEAHFAYLPLQMLVCPSDGSGGPHCGYGGVDTSPEAYANPDPLAIINEHCTAENRWDCPFPGPINYGPDSPAIWLPEEDILDDPTLVRKVWPDYPPPSKTAAERSIIVSPQVLRLFQGR